VLAALMLGSAIIWKVFALWSRVPPWSLRRVRMQATVVSRFDDWPLFTDLFTDPRSVL